jgi:hypothetical protein
MAKPPIVMGPMVPNITITNRLWKRLAVSIAREELGGYVGEDWFKTKDLMRIWSVSRDEAERLIRFCLYHDILSRKNVTSKKFYPGHELHPIRNILQGIDDGI